MHLRRWISFIAIALFILGAWLVHHETGMYPMHWIALSAFGLIALWCGPGYYRILGAAAIAMALFFSYEARQIQNENSTQWDPSLKEHP